MLEKEERERVSYARPPSSGRTSTMQLGPLIGSWFFFFFSFLKFLNTKKKTETPDACPAINYPHIVVVSWFFLSNKGLAALNVFARVYLVHHDNRREKPRPPLY